MAGNLYQKKIATLEKVIAIIAGAGAAASEWRDHLAGEHPAGADCAECLRLRQQLRAKLRHAMTRSGTVIPFSALRTCERAGCGKRFRAGRLARYCSAACKQAAWRDRRTAA